MIIYDFVVIDTLKYCAFKKQVCIESGGPLPSLLSSLFPSPRKPSFCSFLERSLCKQLWEVYKAQAYLLGVRCALMVVSGILELPHFEHMISEDSGKEFQLQLGMVMHADYH